MDPSARDSFEKLDVKKNLGMDFYQFETHVRNFVMDLVEPTLSKANEDHKLVRELSNGYEGMR